MHKGEVQPQRKQSATVAVQSRHLLLDITADAGAMVSVHPPPHHTNADLMFMFAKYKALSF